MKNTQTIGGIAALGHAAARVVRMVLSFTLMFLLLDAAPDQAQRFLSSNQTLVNLWNLIVDWGSVTTLLIMLLALYERMKPGSPVLMRAAVIFGLLWAVQTIRFSSLILHNFGVVANFYGSVPAQVAAWTALVRGLWVLLLSLSAIRTGGLTRAIGYLGVFLGIAGSLTMIPAFAEILFTIFGSVMMVWAVWIGIDLLRRGPVSARYA